MVFLSRILRCAKKTELPELVPWFKKWYFDISHYNRYGLYYDDLLNEEYNPEIAEAVRRLPPDLYDGRTFRMVRAANLDFSKSFLPKEEWPTYEEDQTKGRYLQPYIDEVLAEWREKEDWERTTH